MNSTIMHAFSAWHTDLTKCSGYAINDLTREMAVFLRLINKALLAFSQSTNISVFTAAFSLVFIPE